MRSAWLALALCLCATTAEAQVQQGNFKLSIDTDVLNYSVQSSKNDTADYENTTKDLSVGPGGSGPTLGLPGYVAFAVGYVVHPHVIPQLHFSLAHLSGSEKQTQAGHSDERDSPSGTLVMLRPEVEIPFNPDSRVVGFGLVGFDYRHVARHADGTDGDPDFDSTLNGYGPILGGGAHIFVGDVASLDLGAQFSYLVFSSELDGHKDKDTDLSAAIFSITAGMSLWP